MKVALITGAGSGMGEATARQLVKEEGCAVVITGRREEPLRALEAELGKDVVEVVALDITADEAPKRLVEAAMDRFGRLDYLVNNAGIGKPTPVHETTDAIFDEFINILLRAPFRLCREALEVMGDGGSIVNVASTFAIVGGMRGGPYSAAKGGIVALSKHMAAQYGPRGIRTNVLAPGVIETPMVEYAWSTLPRFARMNFDMTPLNRTGTSEDAAEAICFLLSDRARFITGQVLALDGGWSSTKFLAEKVVNAVAVEDRHDGRGKRRTAAGWSLRIDPERAAAARDGGWWVDKTAGDYAEKLAAKEPNRILVTDGVRSLDAATLLSEAKVLARGFIRRGFKPGDVVSMMLPNWHELTVVALAAGLAGVVLHPVVTAYREAEIAFMLGDCDSRMIFVPEAFRGYDFATMMKTVCSQVDRPPEVVVVRGERGEFTDYAKMFQEDVAGVQLPKVDPDSVKILIYTSGTTGRAKGVIHTHNSSLAVCMQVNRHWRIDGDDRFFIPSPVGHIGGSMYAFDMPVLFGARAVLQDVWDPDEGVKIIDEQGCTFIAGATPFLQQLLASSRAVGSRLPSMRLFICGGASVPPALIREAKDYLTNCTVTRVYGSTEVPVATVGSPDPGDTDHAAETDGRPGTATAKLIGADGHEGEEGEIWLRGPQMLVGYLHLEDEQSTFDQDGFFRTGDLARRVDGSYLVVSGRSKDLIIRNGENISPKEVEDLLVQHPKIADIAIVGLPSQRTGELACAVIVPRTGEEPDVADLRAFLEERRVARFKIPEQVELWTELPRNPAGKILKNRIRDALLAKLRQGAS